MKKLALVAFMAIGAFALNAQVTTPQPSPFAKVEQKVGLTDITLEYSRPGVKGRTIFGDLVPYGKMWRTGANKNTMISFSTDVKVGGKDLKAGSYAIFTQPNASSWDVFFYSDTNNWGTPQEWDESKVAAKVSAPVSAMPMRAETFTINFGQLTNSSTELGFIWANTYAGLKIEVPTDNAVQASIEKTMGGPGPNDYFSAAVYYLQEGKDIKKAMTWIDKAVEMTNDKPRFWYLRQQSLIHAKAGKTKTAIKAAKKSMELAEKAGNADYVKMNKDSLKEWGAL
ncbi:DUF2911 domain-containing protein [Sungkyunkwania multivorans]|uniref:DUF2911 domain-containing protein n=1 Tax=Sungkyunkwania multivorans TaxID=1173618 RepID=A0ABW3CY73_9FLAO